MRRRSVSQSSVNDVAAIADSMAVDGWQGTPIAVVKMADGGLTTVDNTRLLAASLTETPVRAVVFDSSAPIDISNAVRFAGPKGDLPATWGEAVLRRIGNQNKSFRTNFPSGSPSTSVKRW